MKTAKQETQSSCPPAVEIRLSNGRRMRMVCRPRKRLSRLLMRLLSVCIPLFLTNGHTYALDTNALPTGGRVTAGQATISQTAASLTVQQASQRAALNWQTFNIGASAAVAFNQPNSSAVALNTISGGASEIYGKLTANGQVFFSNPDGMLFAKGAQVNVGGMLATTLNISDQDFMSGNYRLSGPGNGIIRNEGILAATGGIALIGSTVQNAGEIYATTVSLAAGNSVAVDLSSDGLIRARVVDAALKASIENSGTIGAAQVALTAGQARDTIERVVNNTGVIRATGLSMQGGEIVLEGGRTLNSGVLDASSASGKGGTVQMLGNQVGITGSGSIDASGRTGGGTILVGGDLQGKNPDVLNASATYVGANTQIKADATDAGDGGKVIVWSNDATRVYGNISARGGALSGNGGFVETSGKEWLDFAATVDTSAPRGATGTLLLDPKNIDVNDTGGLPYVSGVNNLFAILPTGTSIILASGVGSISAQTSNVLLQANNDITFTSAVNITNPGTTLTAQAGRSILVNADITTTNADIMLTANETTANGVVLGNRDPGAGGISMAPGTSITAGTGNIFLRVNDGSGHAGATTASNIVFENLIGNNVSIINDNLNSGSNILRGSASSLITAATSVFMELEFAAGATDSIGTSAAPIRVSTPVLETHYHNAGGGIFIDSPNAGDLQIGGVPGGIFSGLVRGVQTVSGGQISISVNGNLSQLAVDASCGLTGGTGGPICASGATGNVTLSTADSIALNNIVSAGGLLYLVAGGDVSQTSLSAITVDKLAVRANNVGLTANNMVNFFAANATNAYGGYVNFFNAKSFTVGGTADGLPENGITAGNASYGGSIALQAGGGAGNSSINITQPVTAVFGSLTGSSIFITAEDLDITGAGTLQAGYVTLEPYNYDSGGYVPMDLGGLGTNVNGHFALGDAEIGRITAQNELNLGYGTSNTINVVGALNVGSNVAKLILDGGEGGGNIAVNFALKTQSPTFLIGNDITVGGSGSINVSGGALNTLDLIANTMSIGGSVTADVTQIAPYFSRDIELGATIVPGALQLSAASLGNLYTTDHLAIGVAQDSYGYNYRGNNIVINGPVSFPNSPTVGLMAGDGYDITQSATGNVTVDHLVLTANPWCGDGCFGGGVDLSTATNMVNMLEGSAGDNGFYFKNGKSLTIVGDVSTGNGASWSDIGIEVTSGSLTINPGVTISAADNQNLGSGYNVDLSATGAGGKVLASGAQIYGVYASISADGDIELPSINTYSGIDVTSNLGAILNPGNGVIDGGVGNVSLTAEQGIGTPINPIRTPDLSIVYATNNTSGDIALSQTINDILIDGGDCGSCLMQRIVNNAPNGGLDLTAEQGGITQQSGTVLQFPGSIGLHAKNGNLNINADITSSAGGVALDAYGGSININSSSPIYAGTSITMTDAIVANGNTLQLTTGSGDITTGNIAAPESNVSVVAGGAGVVSAGNINTYGSIVLGSNGTNAGNVTIQTGSGSISVGSIDARGGAGDVDVLGAGTSGGNGGVVSITSTSGNVTLANASIMTGGGRGGDATVAGFSGGVGGSAGQITISALSGNPTLSGTFDASGGNGGDAVVSGTLAAGGAPGNSADIVLGANAGTNELTFSGATVFNNTPGFQGLDNTGAGGGSAVFRAVYLKAGSGGITQTAPITGGQNIDIDSGGNVALTDAGNAFAFLTTEFGPVAGSLAVTGIYGTGGFPVAATGDITLVGAGMTVFGNITSSGGDVSLTAPTGTLYIFSGETVSAPGVNKSVNLVADDMTISGNVTANQYINIDPYTNGRNIDLGTKGAWLGLTNAEVQNLSSLVLNVGQNSIPGSLHISTPIQFTGTGQNLSGTQIDQAAGAVLTGPGGSPTGVYLFATTGSVNMPENNVFSGVTGGTGAANQPFLVKSVNLLNMDVGATPGGLTTQGGSITIENAGPITVTNQGAAGYVIDTTVGGATTGDVVLTSSTAAGDITVQGNAWIRGGTISVTAGGNIALNGTATTGGAILSLGDVTLHADGSGKGITQAAGTTSEIVAASTLTTTSDAGTSLPGGNTVATFTATNAATGDINFKNTGGALILGPVTNSAYGGNIIVATLSTLTVNDAISAHDITLAAGTSFTNAFGVGALTVNGGGRWLVYSVDPAADNRGGLVYDFKQYNKAYPFAPTPASGNGFLYTVAPSVTVGLTGTVTKTYNGDNIAALGAGNYTVGVAIDGDVVTLNNPVAGTYIDKNVGSPKPVSVSGITIASAMDGLTLVPVYGYQVANGGAASANIGTITPATLNVTATGVNKIYDGGTVATVTLGDNRVAGDALTLSDTSAAFSDKNVANGKTVNISGISLGGTDAGNYTLVNATASTIADITPLALTVSASGVNRVYDATTVATVNLSDNHLLSDSLNLAYNAASFADKNVGTGKAVSVSGIDVTGADAGNYTFNTSAGTTADITPASLTVSGLMAQNKVYDATTVATITGAAAFSGVLGTDVVTLGGSASFADKNVGIAKPVSVSVSGLTLSGTDAGNYTLANTTTSTTADITPASLTVSGLTAQNKVYDATTVATITGTAAFSGVLGTDVVTLGGSASASFADKNVGTAKPVGVSGLTLSGTDAGNYTLANATATTTANITPASLTVTGLAAQNKVYDATTVATVSGPGTLGGIISGDTVNLSGTASAAFADKNVGNAKPVTVAGVGLAGTDAGNYVVTPPVGLAANITPKALITSVVADDKVYDGTTAATISSLVSMSGILQGDLVAPLLALGAFDNKNAGVSKPVDYIIGLSGADVGNYTAFGVTAASITQRPLVWSVTDSQFTFGGLPILGVPALYVPTLNNMIAGDDVAAGTPGVFDKVTNVQLAVLSSLSAGSYAEKVIELTGADRGNYQLVASIGNVNSIPGTLTVNSDACVAACLPPPPPPTPPVSAAPPPPAAPGTQTLVVGGTTIQRPADSMVDMPSVRGQQLVCR
jgi:filamentous hemagglutinin family protein